MQVLLILSPGTIVQTGSHQPQQLALPHQRDPGTLPLNQAPPSFIRKGDQILFQPVQLHRQLANLPIQILLQRFLILEIMVPLVREQLGQGYNSLALPLGDDVGWTPKWLANSAMVLRSRKASRTMRALKFPSYFFCFMCDPFRAKACYAQA